MGLQRFKTLRVGISKYSTWRLASSSSLSEASFAMPDQSLPGGDVEQHLPIFAFSSPFCKIQFVLRFLFLFLPALPLFAQGNYEIQVYGAETVEPHHTMVELHSNFTIQGSKSRR